MKALAALALASFLLFGCVSKSTLPPSVTVGNQRVWVEVASTPAAWSQGLSGREELGENHGMLFVFPVAQQTSFWMHGMRFPIDILWITDGLIAGIQPNMPIPTTSVPIVYPSPGPVDAVLEVSAGFAQAHSFVIGQPVVIDLAE